MIGQPVETITSVEHGTERLWLIGIVDYRDRFGLGHRAGYGPRYDRYTRELIFDETTASLNYDRPLTPEEERQYTV